MTLSIESQGHVQQTIRVASDDAGEWAIPLNGTMNQGPFVVKLTSMGQTLAASDVWFGTVLLCGGQSNMVRIFPFNLFCVNGKSNEGLLNRTHVEQVDGLKSHNNRYIAAKYSIASLPYVR